jgi:hypothetical protein
MQHEFSECANTHGVSGVLVETPILPQAYASAHVYQVIKDISGQ